MEARKLDVKLIWVCGSRPESSIATHAGWHMVGDKLLCGERSRLAMSPPVSEKSGT